MTRRNENSSRMCEISDRVIKQQIRMFDLAERQHGMTLKVLHLETDIPTGTLRGWIAGTSMMPLDGFIKLAGVKGFPNELLSLALDIAGKSIADAEPEETDIDDLARAAVEVLQRYVAARHPDSPGGIRIVHNEKDDITLSAARLRDRAGKVAA